MPINKLPTLALESNAITADLIASGAITAADISDGEITAAKLHTTLDFSTKTFTMANAHVTQAMVTQHQSALSVTQSQISDLSTTSDLTEGTNLYYTDARADARAQLKIDAIVGAAPGTLDTLEELGDALGDDPNFATTVTNSIATKLPLSGGTLTGGLAGTSASFATITSTSSIQLGDSVKAQFGSSNDLQIYHDGSDSYIKDAGAGYLNLLGTGRVIVGHPSNGHIYLNANYGGDVELFYNNVQKLATTSTGVDITGTLDVSGAISYPSGTLNYTGTSVPTGANNQGLYIPTYAIGLGGAYGSLNFPTTSSALTTTAWWMLGRAGGSDDEFTLRVRRGGTAASDQTAYVVTTSGADSAKIIDSHKWYTGASGSEVMRLSNDGNVHLNSGVDVRIQLGTSGTGATSVSDNSVYVRGNDDDLILGAAGNGNIFFKENAATHMTIQPGGNVGIGTASPANALRVVASASQATNDGAVVIKNEMNNGFETLKLETDNSRDSVLSFRSVGTNSYWWGMGIDNSDAGKFKMGADNLLGVNNRLVITQAGNVGINVASPQEKLDVDGAIVSGNSSKPINATYSSGGDMNSFEHRFTRVKSGAGSPHVLVDIQFTSNFHQAMFVVEYGARLQAVSDSATDAVIRSFGVNRFNGGNCNVTAINNTHFNSNVSNHAPIYINVVSQTRYQVVVNFSGTVQGSSFVSGSIRGYGVNSEFPTITFSDGMNGH